MVIEQFAPLLLQLKVQLRGVHPAVWRRVSLVDSLSITDLHRVIQLLLRWDEPHLRLTPASSPTGEANFEAYTAPYLVGQPDIVRRIAPKTIGLVTVSGLPSVAPGSPEAQAAVQRIIERSAAARSDPRQTFTLGAGIAGGGGGVHPLLRSSWRYSFQPRPDVGGLLQVPLQVDLFYAPSSSVLGAVSSGVGTSLSSLRIPVNIRLTAGIGGGAVNDASQAAFGPTIGTAVGYERDWFRAEVRYDQLFNLLPGPNVPTGSVGIGGAF